MRNTVPTNHEEDTTTLTGGRHLEEEVFRRGSSAPDPIKHRTSQPPTSILDEAPPRSKPRYGRGSDGNRNNAARRTGRCRSN